MASLTSLSVLALMGALLGPVAPSNTNAKPAATATAQAKPAAAPAAAPARPAAAPARPAVAATTDEAAAIADRVQAVYDDVRDFSADFTQDYTNASLGSSRSSTGRVFFKKPGKMRWDYKAPNERYLISDGSQLWVYEPEFAQYYNQSLTDSQLPSAMRFLMGEGKLRDEFSIRVRNQTAEKITLELVPKQRSSQFARLHFVVDATTYQVLETTVFDALGNTNRLRFSKVRQNTNLPDNGFDFAPPAGTTRVEPPAN